MKKKSKAKPAATDNYHQNLVKILEQDFDDLILSELQFLRNHARKTFKLDAKVNGTIGHSQLLQVYLNWKRRYIPIDELEKLLISPLNAFKINSAFANRLVAPGIPVHCWDGAMAVKPCGMFLITEPIILRVLTVNYTENQTTVICLSPEGNFCKITSCQFLFDI